MDDIRIELAYLTEPPFTLLVGEGYLTPNHQEWTQNTKLWTMFYYHHTNAITMNNRTYAVESGDIALVPPGTSGAHARIGEDLHFDFYTFDLPAKEGLRLAIPVINRQMQEYLPNLRRASNRVFDTKSAAVAFIWNLLWNIAKPASLYRSNEALYLAEDYIRRNLDAKFSAQDVSDAAEVSPRTLLKLFRAEHGITLQEYILQKRVQEATRLLLRTEMSIKEIASCVGIHDAQYFNKIIRSMTGMAPTKIRSQKAHEVLEKE